MRLISFSFAILFALLSSAALAQQPAAPGPAGEAIGHPPPLPGPPPVTQPAPPPVAGPAPAPQAGTPAQKGYIGAYAPASDNSPPPYYKGPLPTVDTSTGLSVVGPDGSTKTVKAVRCTTASRETDGTTTCVGIPEQSARRKRR
jgi:hypothetical protein